MDEKNRAEKSTLYVVATPIGNLHDMTFRAVGILESVDLIAAEDTRHTARLLSFFNITTKLLSCHEHNETMRARQLVERLLSGESVALVSNAGTPSVSDPGYRIVKQAIAAGIKVVPIPGVSAAITALSASAMPSDMFCFIGFITKKKSRQDAFLNELAERRETLIFYESPRRLVTLLKTVEKHLGDRYVVVARELTKIYEEFLRGRVSEVLGDLEKRDAIKGEITLLVAGKTDEGEEDPNLLEEEIRQSILENSLSPSRLAATLAKRYNLSKNDIYRLILEVQARYEPDADDDEKGNSTDG